MFLAGSGEDLHGAGFDGGLDLGLKIGDAEVVVGFAEAFVRRLMVGADAVVFGVVFIGNEAFATGTIPAFVGGGVDVGGEFLPDELDTASVSGVASADEVGGVDAELGDEILEFGGVGGDVGFDGDVLGFGFVPDFIAMFVGAGLEADGDSLLLFEAGVNVGEKVVEGVASVGSAVDIGDGGSDIAGFRHSDYILLYIWCELARWRRR